MQSKIKYFLLEQVRTCSDLRSRFSACLSMYLPDRLDFSPLFSCGNMLSHVGTCSGIRVAEQEIYFSCYSTLEHVKLDVHIPPHTHPCRPPPPAAAHSFTRVSAVPAIVARPYLKNLTANQLRPPFAANKGWGIWVLSRRLQGGFVYRRSLINGHWMVRNPSLTSCCTIIRQWPNVIPRNKMLEEHRHVC